MRKLKVNGKTLLVYILGHMILACGVSLNTKTFLGVSPVVSVAYNASVIFGLSIGLATFIYMTILIFIQFLLLRKGFKAFQLLQVLAAFLNSFFLQVCDGFLSVSDHLLWRLLALLIGVGLTGLGASLTVAMKVLPIPGDALAHTVGLVCRKSFGFGKNVLDIICISLSSALGLIFCQDLLGIGLGTLVAMVLTGRVIALCHPWSERVFERLIRD